LGSCQTTNNVLEIGSGNNIAVSSGGVLSAAGFLTSVFVSSGGVLTLLTNGNETATHIGTGGFETVSSGAFAVGDVLLGSVVVLGQENGLTISSGGVAIVSSGGLDINGSVIAGSGYVVSGFNVQGGVTVGLASGATISGGTLEIKSGGSTGTGAVTFATSGGGVLQLDDSQHFSGLVAGFGLPDQMFLKDLSFVSGATSATWSQTTVSSGTLAVSAGATTVDITLLGQYSTGNFHVSSGTGGGTVVTDPPVVAQTDPQPGALVNPHQA
jgi:autotransporter passenger strand-loop-strand repeat protein